MKETATVRVQLETETEARNQLQNQILKDKLVFISCAVKHCYIKYILTVLVIVL